MSALQGKTAVVTGVTSGIGEALVSKLLDAGASVIGLGRDPDKLGARAARWGERFQPLVCDLASPERRAEGVAKLLALPGAVHVLVNNAAECVYELPLTLPVERWRRLLEVNVLAGLELAQALVPRMTDGGHIVNTSSVTARFLPNARFAPYATTKATLEAVTQALRLEVDPLGIKVTLIAPGLVDTAIYDKVPGFEKTRAKITEQVPVWLHAGDVADAVMWALSRPAHVVVSEIVIMPRGQAR